MNCSMDLARARRIKLSAWMRVKATAAIRWVAATSAIF